MEKNPTVWLEFWLVSKQNHYGSLEYGHCNTAILEGDNWILCNDTTIMKLEKDEVVTGSAYILVYEKESEEGENYGKELAISI